MKKTAFSLTLLALISFSINAQFPIAKLSAVDDTWIDQSRPEKNLNEETGMHIFKDNSHSASKIVYLKFDVSGLKEQDSVVLMLKGGKVIERDNYDPSGENLYINLKALKNNAWKEEGLIWNNKPAGESGILAELDGYQDEKKGFFSFTGEALTDYVNNAIRNNEEFISFTIEGKNNVPGLGIWVSGEKWIAPQLYFYNKIGDVDKPVISPKSGAYEKAVVSIESEPGTKVYYTLDRTLPNEKSKRYKKPFRVERKAVVTAIAYKGNEKSLFAREFIYIKDNAPVNMVVDVNKERRTLKNVWQSTGFSPAEFLLRPDMQQTFEYQGAVHSVAVDYVRPHYLLNLVGVEDMHTKNPRYNWTKLDEALDVLVENDLKLIFEIMGTPSSSVTDMSAKFDKFYQEQVGGHETFFSNYYDKEKLNAWKRLIKDLAAHLIERYGQEEVRSWYFETSNEPNINHFWKHSLPEFINYYDACSEGLYEADELLRFGGPGVAGWNNDFFKELLAHCDTGTNYFTKEKGVRIDFISIHHKTNPNIMVETEADIHRYIMENHPSLSNVPLINDESDPMVGWGKDIWWRPRPWYAAFVAQSADLHDKILIDSLGYNYGFVSNDNAFMGGWYNRTQLTRFVNPDDPDQFSMIKKPVFTVTSMLGMLGRTRLSASYPEKYRKHLGIIPSMHSDGKVAVLIYNKGEVHIQQNKPLTEDAAAIGSEHKLVKLNINNLPLDKYTFIHYRIDEETSNPYKKWIEMGSPEFPATDQLALLRENQELSIVDAPEELVLTDNSFHLDVMMPSSSVSLIVLAPKSFALPGEVESLTAKKYTGLNGERDVLLKWKYYGDNILSYEVWFTPSLDMDFVRVNTVNLVDRAFLHSTVPESKGGYYKVRVVDYWGNQGKFSNVIKCK